jgi:two-component system chemotaxis response regulator CheY
MSKKGLVTNDALFMRVTLRNILTKGGYEIVTMCTAMGQKAMGMEAVSAEAKDFLVKPFQADKVIESVQKLIGA